MVHEVYDDGFEHDPGYAYDAVKAEAGDAEQKPALGDEDEYEDEGDMLKQDDYWLVINTFFEDKGLVRQQLESFNEFVETTLQEVVDDNAQLLLDQHQQYTDNEKDVSVRPEACDHECVRDEERLTGSAGTRSTLGRSICRAQIRPRRMACSRRCTRKRRVCAI